MAARSDHRSHRQGNLFARGDTAPATIAPAPELALQPHQLAAWQDRLSAYQRPLFEAAAEAEAGSASGDCQLGLLAPLNGPGSSAGPGSTQAGAGGPAITAPLDPALLAERFNPHSLRDQHLQFWRWPAPPQQGAALYLVLDRPERLGQPLLLYVGETGQADRRWKGEHDCKGYVAAYSEALHGAGMGCRLSIRFWCDVPAAVRPRRALEQALIRRWLPPFNKETRERWATPFTALAD